MKHQNLEFKWMCLLFLALLLSPPLLWGQNHSIKGQIVDAKSNEPLIGVNITVEGTSNGTISDIDGRFTLSVATNAVLKISYIGYQEKKIKVNDLKKETIISLEEDSKQLEEVVVVGYGIQKKVSSVGAITQTKGEELLKGGNITSVSEALQGKLNGLVAINTSGKPGASDTKMYIRGKASWQNSDPLVLVDGIERDMNDVDMNEIESISILKDASDTAVYGVRGANGVILLTTKRGQDKKPNINFSTSFGIKQTTANMEWADYVTSMKMYNEAVANDNNWNQQIKQSVINAWSNAFDTGNYGPYNDVFPQVDWWDELVKPGFSQQYNVNISGGTNFMRYFASIGYQNDGDIYDLQKQENFDPRNYYRRYNWRSNLDFNLTKTTSLSVNIAGKMGYRNDNFADDVYTRIIAAPTNSFPIKYSDGYWGDGSTAGYNPVCNMNTNGSQLYKTFQGWYDVRLEQKLDFLTKGLKAAAKVSYTSASTTRSSIKTGEIWGNNDFESRNSIIKYHREYDYSNPIVNADGSLTYPMILEKRWPNDEDIELPPNVSYDNLDGYNRKLYYEFSVEYNRSFGSHNITALALMNRQVSDSKDDKVIKFPSYREEWVGRVTYNWKERYLAEMNISYTGSEKFARGQRFGLFPSYSLGWRASEEPFIKKHVGDVLTNLKFRYSYGKVGSDAAAARWNYIQLFNSLGSIELGNTQGVTHSPLYTEGDIANLTSTWEKATKHNFGIEIGLWNKLDLTLDLFKENRKDILMTPQTTSSIVGATFNAINRGETKNHGLELELRWNDKIGRNFNYWGALTFATSENRIVYKDDPRNADEHLKAAGKPIDYQNRFIAIGNYGSIDDVFNYAQTAINGTTASQVIPGDLIYIDFNGDGIINSNDKVVVDELNYPLTTIGFSFGFNWKGLNFSAMLYSPRNIYKLQFDQYLWDFPASNIRVQPKSMERWTPETANSSGVMRPTTHLNNTYNKVESTYRYSDYSYIRLKNMEIGYTFPKKWLSEAHISNLQVYMNGNNLLTFWKGDKRVDPETGGVGSYPIVRTYTLGLRVSF